MNQSSHHHFFVAKTTTQSSRGFSLVEILAVIAVIALLLGASVGSMQGIVNGSGVRGAVSLASGIVELARTEATLRGGGARIIIDADPTSPGYLRRIAVVRGVREDDGSISWQVASRPQQLPEHTFFSEEFSGGFGSMQFAFPGDGGGNSECLFFEYDHRGRLVPAAGGGLTKAVFVRGRVLPDGTLEVPDSLELGRQGFILRPAGNVTHFDSADQILRSGS